MLYFNLLLLHTKTFKYTGIGDYKKRKEYPKTINFQLKTSCESHETSIGFQNKNVIVSL
jgi:hypothetical protein